MFSKSNYPRFARSVFTAPSKYASLASGGGGGSGNSNSTPNRSLVPEHVYGCSAKGTKGNIMHMNSEGHLVYPSAACGIVWDVDNNRQVIFNQHGDDVVCVGLHPDRVLAATGQIGKDDMIHVWDTRTGELVTRLDTRVHFQAGGVLSLCFSNDGSKIAAVGGNPLDSVLLIYDWQSGALIGKTKCHNESVYCLQFLPDDSQVVMCGKDIIKFFSVESRITVRQGVFYPRGTAQTLYSCTFDRNGSVICGAKDGSIYVFSGNRLTQKHAAHQGSVYTIYPLPHDNGFVTGGADGFIRIWLYTGVVTEGGIAEFQLASEIKLGSSVRSVCPDLRGDGTFYVMQFNGDTIRLNTHTGDVSVIAKSHTGVDSELWGLCDIPGTTLFASGGDDSRIIIWNRATRSFEVDFRIPLKGKVRGLASNGTELAASTLGGSVFIYKLTSLLDGSSTVPIKELRDGREEITAIQYSPDGHYLACGSHDNVIYVHDAHNYSLVCKLTGHNSYVKHIDFSSDSQYLQSVCGAYELLYWSLAKRSQVRSMSEVKDVDWATQTCSLGWTVKGIWEPQMDGTDINALDVSFSTNLIATADDRGLVRLLNYPAVAEPSASVAARGHSSHVTNVKFVDGTRAVLSAGGYDLTVFQWRVK